MQKYEDKSKTRPIEILVKGKYIEPVEPAILGRIGRWNVMENLSCKGEELILTLWTFTVTDVPARPLSFRAAASLSIPSSLSPVDHKQLSELRYFILTNYRTRGTWAIPFHFTRRHISNSESNYIYWRTRNFHQSKEKGSWIPDYSKKNLSWNKIKTKPCLCSTW